MVTHSSSSSQTRLLFLEMLATWQGYVRNKDLVDQFSITRQQAYQDIRTYQKRYPDRLHKMDSGPYQYTDDYLAQASQESLEYYLLWLSTGQFNPPPLMFQASLGEHCVLPQRHVAPQVMAVLTEAIRQQKRIELGYVSLSHPESEGRIFHPHTFVKTNLRWHVRGYCEKSRGYRDLVLSRCRGNAELLDDSQHTKIHDDVWNRQVELLLAPNPNLSADQQDVIAHDYQMLDGQLRLITRAALVDYLLRDMQVKIQPSDDLPEERQLILLNPQDVAPWLFQRSQENSHRQAT